MIKTHRPRGHQWTNASGFQQSKEYRNISFEECITPTSQILYRDDDDHLSKAQRTAKRRKIEKLADEFLNGVPLFISSARPCPQSLRSTIVWNKKSSNEPKFSLPASEAPADSNGDKLLWEEQESTTEILERLKQRHEQAPGSISAYADTATEQIPPHDVPEIIEAQASCGPMQRSRLRVINARPSEEALRQAAALRSRSLQYVTSDITVVQDSIPCTADVTRVDDGLPTEPPLATGHLHPAAWLSRRKSKFSFDDGEVQDDSIDELQLSGSGRLPVHQNAQQQVTRVPCETLIAVSETETWHEPACKEVPRDDTSSETNSYHTASEQSKMIAEPDPSDEQSQSASSHPSRPTRKPRYLPHDLSQAVATATASVDRLKRSDHSTPHRSSAARVTRSATLRRAQLEETTKSTAPNDHVSFIQTEPKQATYVTAQRSQNGSTPLAYRKGRLPARKTSLERGQSDAQELIPVEALKTQSEHLVRQDSAHSPNQIDGIDHEPHTRPDSVPENWAGTQFLLNQAQRDLIVSPEKQNAIGSTKDQASPSQHMETPRTEPNAREPLKQLSQEPLPSTQQLIDNFEGWSTIRKPRAGYKESPLPTPTATGKSGWTAINASRAEVSTLDPSVPKGDSRIQSSKLRFSMPVPTSSTEAASPTESRASEQRPSKPSPPKTPTPTPILRPSKQGQSSPEGTSRPSPSAPLTEDNLTFSTLTSAPFLSSFQPGQVEGGLSREPSNLSEAIDDVTRDVLNMEDMVDVLSQVG